MNNETNPFQAPQAPVRDHADATADPRIFSASGRLNRIRYLAYSMGINVLSMLIMGVLVAALTPLSGILSGIVMVVGYLFLIVLQFMLTIQRSHDFNTNGWFSLLVIIPLAFFVFCLIPGTAGENKYGAPNPPNSVMLYLGACLLPLIAIVGILSAIAIPAYHDYSKRAKAAQMRQSAPSPATQPQERPSDPR